MSGEYTVKLTAESFEETIAEGVTLVDFWADWCGPCRVVGPVVDELAEEFNGRARVCKLNVDENQSLAIRYGVMSIPTMIVFKDGAEIDRSMGAKPKSELTGLLERHL